MAPKQKVKESVEKDTTEVTVNIPEFTRTRDALVTSLTQLNGAIEHAIKSYISHSNTVLSGNDQLSHEHLSFIPGLLASSGNVVVKEEDAAPEGKKRRKRNTQPRDPNAPKRPLTAYLLYLDDKRPLIQAELGGNQKRGDISAEGTRRWHALQPEEQQTYKDRYRASYELYKEEAKKYKESGGNLPDEELEEAADEDAEVADVPTPDEVAPAAEAESSPAPSTSSESDDDDEDEDESGGEEAKAPTPPPVPKAKTPKKAAAAAKKAAAAAVEAAPASSPAKSNKKPKADQVFTAVNGAAPAGSSSPSLKRKSPTKAADEDKDAEAEKPKAKRNRKPAAAKDAAKDAVVPESSPAVPAPTPATAAANAAPTSGKKKETKKDRKRKSAGGFE